MIVATDHHCWKCRYNVRGLSETDRCPECGTAIDLSRHPWHGALAGGVEFVAMAVLMLLIAAVVFLDILIAVSLHGRVVPVAWLFAAVVAVPVWLIRRRRGVAWLFVALSALFLVLPYVPHTRLKAYGQFYAGIEPGMTRAAVVARLDEYFPDRGTTRVPTVREDNPDRLALSLGGNGMPYNAELIRIQFTGGVVSSTSYTFD